MALGDNIKNASDELKDFKDQLIDLDDAIASIGQSISNDIQDQLKSADKLTQDFAKTFTQDLTRSIKKSGNELDAIDSIQKKINAGQDTSKEIQKDLTKLQDERAKQLRKIAVLERNGVSINEVLKFELEEQYKAQTDLLKAQTQLVVKRKEDLGVIGKVTSGVQGLLKKAGAGGIAELFNFDKAGAQASRLIRIQEAGGKKQLSALKKTQITSAAVFKNLDKAALRLGAAGGLFALAGKLFEQFKKSDQSTTEIARGLGMSKKEAKAFKKEMMETSGSVLSTNVSLKEQKKGLMTLNKELGGTAIAFDKGILEGAAESLSRLKLSEEAVGNMAKQAMRTGKTFKQLEKEQTAGVLAAEKEFGIRLKLSDVLDEANKMSALTRINLDKFPGGLTKAVALSKQLGANMEAINGAADQLLDFEQSIRAEMKAEALLGRDLNFKSKIISPR